MTAVKKQFERWIPRERSTWVFQVFKHYSFELEKNLATHISSSKFVYTALGNQKAKWEDDVTNHLSFENNSNELFDNLKDWSNSYNSFDNWVNLNSIMAISSSFETYLASIISLALKSDPGLVFGTSKLLDGVTLLKYGTPAKFEIDAYIESCTKGDWNSRTSAFKKIFNFLPPVVERNISALERIRKIRNNVGHSFGRDIEQAKEHFSKNILPSDRVSRENLIKYHRLIWGIAKNIDVYLLKNHIGEYQAVSFYHLMFDSLPKAVHPSIRAMTFKKQIGRSGIATAGKEFCKGLVNYYENL